MKIYNTWVIPMKVQRASIAKDKLNIMDRNLKSLSKEGGRIYQDFTEDIFNGLTTAYKKLKNYRKIILVYPNKAVYPYPKGIVTGFKRFCILNNMDYGILDEIYEGMELQLKDLYILIEEDDNNWYNKTYYLRFKSDLSLIALNSDFSFQLG